VSYLICAVVLADDHTCWFNSMTNKISIRATSEVVKEMHRNGLDVAGPSHTGTHAPCVKIVIQSTSSGGGNSAHTFKVWSDFITERYHYAVSPPLGTPGVENHTYAKINVMVIPTRVSEKAQAPEAWAHDSAEIQVQRREASNPTAIATAIMKRTALPFMLTTQATNEQAINEHFEPGPPTEKRRQRSTWDREHPPAHPMEVPFLSSSRQDALAQV
jgi:hypothetical protein